MSGVDIRSNGLGGCCLKTLRAVGGYAVNLRVIDCAKPQCTNQMWYHNHAWEWFAYKRIFNRNRFRTYRG